RRVRTDTVAIDRSRDLMTIATLLATGVATSGAWHVVATDDLLRYWAISDSIRAGAPYFVTDGVPGDGSFYLVDLPGYPILASLAYEILGHTYAALRTPAILASSLLPLAIWASVRAVGAGRVWALALSLALVTLPHLRTYVVGAAQPDGLLATFMATFLAFLVKSAPAIRGISPLLGWSVTGGVPGSGDYYLVELPVYPLLVQGAFSLLGHTYAALRTPAIVIGTFLPIATWGAARGVGAGRVWAIAIALTMATIPHARTYVFGAAQPDGTFATFLTAFVAFGARAWPALRGDHPLSARLAIATGIAGAASLLTRPEGMVYVGAIVLGTLTIARPQRWPVATWRAVALGVAVVVAPAGAFSAIMLRDLGIAWPGGWANIASVSHVWPNLDTIMRNNLPWYAETIGLPREAGNPVAAIVLVVIVAGMGILSRRAPGLIGVPLATVLGTGVIFLTPTMLAADNFSPITFYRHAAVAYPCVVVALATLGPRAGRTVAPIQIAALAVALTIFAGNVYALAVATERDHNQLLTIYPPEPVVTATGLWRIAPPLPILPMVPGPTNGSSVDPSFDYLGFRKGLFEAVRPVDQHIEDDGRAWALAIAIFGTAGLAVAATDPKRRRTRA
ncbi:MAG: hypothetical protein EB033_15045, partial [Proteobacteria bacterium]|nr:hypothetical protein [Pseudomonadota bacterium]